MRGWRFFAATCVALGLLGPTVDSWLFLPDAHAAPVALENGQGHAPIADAGPDQTVHRGTTVTLDGTASLDSDGDVLSLEWVLLTVPPGSFAQVSDSTSPLPTVFLDLPGSYIASLVVSDGQLVSWPDTVTLTTSNSPPVADAGAHRTARVGDVVRLDGSGSSDVDGDLLAFSWALVSRPAGSRATPTGSTTSMPSVVVDQSGFFAVELRVNDGVLVSDPHIVIISTTNSPPMADAGPDQTVYGQDRVTLDASGSTDVNGGLLAFYWSLTTVPAGSMATISDPGALRPTFVADQQGTYVAQLIASDPEGASAPDAVTITTQNSRPVADAGPDQSVAIGQLVRLDGTGSADADGDNTTFRWSIISRPLGSVAALSDPTSPFPTLSHDRPGDFIVQLIVSDHELASDPDTVMLADVVNRPPLAFAGFDQTVSVATRVVLDGSRSRAVDGDPIRFHWSFTFVPTGSAAVLSESAAAGPSFVADTVGLYVVQLMVSDEIQNSRPDTVTIEADAGPAAAAEPDRPVDDVVRDAASEPANDPGDGDAASDPEWLGEWLFQTPRGCGICHWSAAQGWAPRPAPAPVWLRRAHGLSGGNAAQAPH